MKKAVSGRSSAMNAKRMSADAKPVPIAGMVVATLIVALLYARQFGVSLKFRRTCHGVRPSALVFGYFASSTNTRM